MLLDYYKNHPSLKELLFLLDKHSTEHVHLKNLTGSSFTLFMAALHQTIQKQLVLIYPDKEQAMYAYTDIVQLLGENKCLYLPSSYKRKLKNQHYDHAQVILRNECMEQLMKNNANSILVTYPEAMSEKVIDKILYQKSTFPVHTGEEIDMDFIEEILDKYHFECVDFVHKPGQYACRGALVDVFSFAAENPYRIEFKDELVTSIRTFDFETQTSLSPCESIQITPDLHENFEQELTSSVFSYLLSDALLITTDAILFEQQIKQFQTDRYIHNDEETNTISSFSFKEITSQLEQFIWIEHGQTLKKTEHIVHFNTFPQPSFNKNFDLFSDDIKQKHEEHFSIYFLVEQESQKQRLTDIFINLNINDYIEFYDKSLSYGFIDNDLKLVCYTEHQFFNKFYRHKVRDRFLQSESLSMDEFYSLKPGDYIVHIDHGIGIFAGLEKIELNGKWQEQIKLVFKDKALVYVSIHNLHKISRYKGREGEPPKLSKLGSGAWQKMKNTAKQKVKDIARDLIKLYAERMKQKGFAFSPDTYMQEELESSFFFEDTPDQAKATKTVKEDMEKDVPMDRLICGDVGFGKTEIAIRAAFKAVADNKQVAVLVPTTLLALQHYLTFNERLQKFPCVTEFLTRLKNTKQEKEIIEKLQQGKIDILIGTHKILTKNVVFKDLGLLIIDEEQKFGVTAKERLRQLKTNVDTLTLTATPIPRTLQFSLMGARDMSVIQTPPPNRQPIVTELHTFDNDIIKKAIDFEVGRGGQVFFVHNRIETIYEIKRMVSELCPNVSIAVGHGQMKPAELEKIMIDYMEGLYDVLISTSIIENGIDIPNANTMIINNGQMFGLSDLHQLRGRVGRTNRKAFCYILTPPLDTLPSDARKRLKAIEEFSDLGSGFYIALQDLDIRGAGNLLGAEQSGFIAEIGFDTYQKILHEAIQEIMNETITEFNDDNKEINTIPKKFTFDCAFESDLQLYIPEYYVENITERIRLYKEIDQLEDDNAIASFSAMLKDRFGNLPEEVQGLFQVIKIRQIARELGFEKISIKMNKLTCYFISNKQSDYYDSAIFRNIISSLQQSHSKIALKEHNERLYLQIEQVNNLSKVYDILEKLKQKATY